MTHYVRECVVTYRNTRRKMPAKCIRSAEDAANIARAVIPDGPQERLVAILLDSRHAVLGVFTVGVGGIADCPAAPETVFRAALIAGAAAFILAHNHPSGALEPSDSDVTLTHRLDRGAALLGLQLLDHVIVVPRRYYSFREKGLISGGALDSAK